MLPLQQSMQATIDYILSFLLYGNETAREQVGYTADVATWEKYKVVIVPQKVLYLQATLPWSKHNETIIIEADLIHTAYCLLSRKIEEQMQLDEHQRVCWKKNQTLFAWAHQPILDMWGHQLLELLGLPTPPAGLSGINLTHDVDTIAHYRHLRGVLGGVKRGEWKAVWKGWHSLQADAAFTFPWIIEQDACVSQAKQLYFVKATAGQGFDYPQYDLQGDDFAALVSLLRAHGAEMGLHTSYYTGDISTQTKNLTTAIGQPVRTNRWHYLRTTLPADFASLIAAGITDDYTLGFADYAGFRLGTCRAVRWINPQTDAVTNLVLHPLTVMDCTLSNANYMHLSEEEAFAHCKQLIDVTYQYAGEVTLLWHNHIFENNYHKQLYPQLLKYLQACK